MVKQRLTLVVVWGFALSLIAIAVVRYLSLTAETELQTLETSTSNMQSPPSTGSSIVTKVRNESLFGQLKPVKSLPSLPVRKNLSPLNVSVTGMLYSERGHSVVMLRHSGISEALSEGDYLNMSQSVQVKKITESQVVFDRLGRESSIDVQPREINEQIVEVRTGGVSSFRITDKQQKKLLQTAFSDIRNSPHRFDHYFQWLQVNEAVQLAPGSDPRIFTILPFKLGDQIVAVNNKRFPELTKQELAALLTSQSVLNIELLRNNLQHKIELVIN